MTTRGTPPIVTASVLAAAVAAFLFALNHNAEGPPVEAPDPIDNELLDIPTHLAALPSGLQIQMQRLHDSMGYDHERAATLMFSNEGAIAAAATKTKATVLETSALAALRAVYLMSDNTIEDVPMSHRASLVRLLDLAALRLRAPTLAANGGGR